MNSRVEEGVWDPISRIHVLANICGHRTVVAEIERKLPVKTAPRAVRYMAVTCRGLLPSGGREGDPSSSSAGTNSSHLPPRAQGGWRRACVLDLRLITVPSAHAVSTQGGITKRKCQRAEVLTSTPVKKLQQEKLKLKEANELVIMVCSARLPSHLQRNNIQRLQLYRPDISSKHATRERARYAAPPSLKTYTLLLPRSTVAVENIFLLLMVLFPNESGSAYVCWERCDVTPSRDVG
uniref:Uncharacterized protein n=1 Tax=Timema bartmani TaxID=61472 RepID=A0A7R9EM36_9NEOP|nr:unnamed protein product [Timema bartmani]